MDKVEIEFKPLEGDKLTIINKDVVPTLSQYLHLKDEMKAKRHIIIVFVDNEKDEEAVNIFLKESKLEGVMIIIRTVK
uniref:hypothetical protein n=1 Tax=Acidianus hospitalis TaxID=563177 RepID=UPI00159C9400|nr:hypothetical protein [Acidianus hospitalis]